MEACINYEKSGCGKQGKIAVAKINISKTRLISIQALEEPFCKSWLSKGRNQAT
jgi:hypothetical protein